MTIFLLSPQKSQDHEASEGVAEPASSPIDLAPKAPSQDILKAANVSLATVSEVSVDIQSLKEGGPGEEGKQPPTANTEDKDGTVNLLQDGGVENRNFEQEVGTDIWSSMFR